MLLVRPPSFQNRHYTLCLLGIQTIFLFSWKTEMDIFQTWVFLYTEFSHGSFSTLEALSFFDNKRRQNRIFLFFNLASFLTWMWYPDTPVMSSEAQAEATKSECRHMDSSSNLVCNSIITLRNSTGHLTHQCYITQRLLSGTDDHDHLEFPSVTGWVGNCRSILSHPISTLSGSSAFGGTVFKFCGVCLAFFFWI